ncbi:hypothetical protein Tco_0491319 [Tanacetum coccineum]
MMHRLLPYGVQQYLPKSIAAPIIEFCLFFKQLCARTLMQQDMSEAKKQTRSGGPIRYRWMFPFERYMKKLKNYVRNKAKPEGSIAEGYVAEEALTFCSRYLKDDVETDFIVGEMTTVCLKENTQIKFQVLRPEVDADILAYENLRDEGIYGGDFHAAFSFSGGGFISSQATQTVVLISTDGLQSSDDKVNFHIAVDVNNVKLVGMVVFDDKNHIKRNVVVELNWTKRSIFYELEYWSFLILKHNLDVMYIEKNVLESILNTLLMNDKSKDTTKARQDLKRLGIRSGLCLDQNKNRKCSKPQAAYCFTPEDRKKFCQFIKGVKLPDGLGSNIKHKVTDNETNITGLKSHDCHIMMQHLLPYRLQQYLPPDVAKPLIELCLFFKQICSQTLMVDDVESLEQAKPEGSIAEGYVAEEALTFSSHYFQDVTMKFNRPARNMDCPPPTCQFQVFKSLCKSISLRSVIRIDHQELKKVIWYVLHSNPEIDMYQAKFKSEFPNKDMKEEFPDNDPGVSESSELFVLAYGPSQTPILVNSCVVNGVRFVVHSRDEHRTTQNSGISSPSPDGEMYYGQLKQILEFSYLWFKTVLFRVKWFETSNKGRIQNFVIRNNITQIKANGEAFKNNQYILATQVKQCFYLEDMARRPLGWKVVEHVSHKKFLNGGVIVVEDNPDVIHFDNSSDLALSTSLNDLKIAALHIDGQSIDVDAPPDIIDVDEDDDIIDEEDPILHDLADSDDEDLVNLDIDDGVNVMSADVARGHDGDGGGDDRPPPYQIPTGCGGCLGKGTRKPNLGGRRAGRMHTRQKTRNLGLKTITDKIGPVPIRPSLTCVPTWNTIAGQKSMRASNSISKRSTMARRLLSRKCIGFLTPRTGLTTWSASDADVPHKFP